MTNEQQPTRTIDLEKFKDVVGFTATFKCWGNSRKADISTITTEADKSRLRLSKRLIECKEYDAIRTYFSELRTWIYSRTVPSFFKDGFQLATLKAVEDIEKRMKQAVTDDLPPLIMNLALVYGEKVNEAQKALKGQFRASDYPPEDELGDLFSIQWYWVSFTTPKGLPPELLRAEEEKLQKQFADAGEQITLALREAFSQLITHATEKLTIVPGEKPKIFRDSMLGNIQAFIDTFASRDLMNDTELAELVNKARSVLTGVETDKLRKISSIREETQSKLTEIKTALDGMIETKKGRKFDLSDE